ncbi:MAG: PP2C family serine/threonine-protein phosphatase [Pirellulaceae bacterium]
MTQPDVRTQVHVVKTSDLDTLELAAPRTHLVAQCCGLSDRGLVREQNEDQFLVAALDKALEVLQTSLPQPPVRHASDRSYLLVVADGMGGEAAGEEASALALESVEEYVLDALQWFACCEPRDEDQVLTEFREAIGQAHRRVAYRGQQQPRKRGMGTTLTLAHSVNDTLYVAHVGDSRAYLFRQNILYQLTRDHTLVEDMVRGGALKPEEAATHRWRHVITSTVGGESKQIRIDVHRLHLQAGDVVLLCSDGLTEMIPRADLCAVLEEGLAPEACCSELVRRANAAGGKDNITVVMARFREDDPPG